MKVGWDTVPVGVPDTDKLPSEPVNVGVDTVPAGVNLPVADMLEPENSRSTPSPVKEGEEDSALAIPETIVWLEKLGNVTEVGVLGVNVPAVQDNVNVSPETDVSSCGSVQLAAEPFVTVPPPVALEAT